jgi:hypothetical protein
LNLMNKIKEKIFWVKHMKHSDTKQKHINLLTCGKAVSYTCGSHTCCILCHDRFCIVIHRWQQSL